MILTTNDTALLSRKAVKKALPFQKQQCFFSLEFEVWSVEFRSGRKIVLKKPFVPVVFSIYIYLAIFFLPDCRGAPACATSVQWLFRGALNTIPNVIIVCQLCCFRNIQELLFRFERSFALAL